MPERLLLITAVARMAKPGFISDVAIKVGLKGDAVIVVGLLFDVAIVVVLMGVIDIINGSTAVVEWVGAVPGWRMLSTE
jgi:hypothetical protein